MRALLALGLALGPRAMPAADPALAMAMAAGAICQGDDGAPGAPSGVGHDHCLMCQGSAAGMAAAAACMPGAEVAGEVRPAPAVAAARAAQRWPAYAPRAPPGIIG